jgi:hypothetical protein
MGGLGSVTVNGRPAWGREDDSGEDKTASKCRCAMAALAPCTKLCTMWSVHLDLVSGSALNALGLEGAACLLLREDPFAQRAADSVVRRISIHAIGRTYAAGPKISRVCLAYDSLRDSF